MTGRRSLAAMLGLIGLVAAAPLAHVSASTPDPQSVTVPTAGNSVTLNWSGTIPAGSHGNSSCAAVPSDPTLDHQHITVTVPGGLYATSTAVFAFSITWTPVSGNETTNDEILTLVGPSGNEIASSDTSNTTEAVSQTNLASGTYDVQACGFVNVTTAGPQAYAGKLTITTSLTPPPTPTPSPAAPHANPITFGVPSVMDPIHPFGEPDIGIDNLGRTFVSGPAGTGTQRSVWESSVDGGHTYRVISPGPIPPDAAQSFNAGGPGGGDTEIVFDNGAKAGHANTGQYFADLYALTCFRVAATFNGGSTVAQNSYPGGCAGNQPTSDRQWMAVYDPVPGTPNRSAYTGPKPLVYLEYNGGGGAWTKSNDGTGVNYTFADGSTMTTPVRHFGTNAYIAIDQETGKVFEATFSGAQMKMNIGTPMANGDLCFLDDTLISHPPCPAGPGPVTVATNPTSGNGGLFVVMSIDAARNLYVGWIGAGNQAFVAAAPPDDTRVGHLCTDCWTNWTAPVQVSDGLAVTGDQINVFPWIKGGGTGGMADMVWYGDSSNLSPSSTSPGHVWNVFMSQMIFPTDAMGHITGGSPDNQLVKVSPHPMDYLDICLSGTLCAANQGNRNLADFFEVNIDATGAAEVVYNDMSNGLVQQPQTCATGLVSTPADHCGAALVMVVRQNGGMGLNGHVVSGPSAAPVTGMKDVTGDALYAVIQGSNLPAMDLTESDLSLSGNTLTVTMKVADLTQMLAAQQATHGATGLLEYITRWQMGNTLYYANAYATGDMTTMQFSAGTVQSIDLCSVSLCDPHVLVYPEVDQLFAANIESGTKTCPPSPSGINPCTITINVNAAHIGNPTSTSFLESVGAYAYTTSHFQSGTTNAEAQADSVPLEIDGVCCYNFGQAPNPNNIPEFPWAPFALVAALTSIGAGALIRRRGARRGVVL